MTDIGVTRARNETMLIGCKGRKYTQATRDWDTSLDNRSILHTSEQLQSFLQQHSMLILKEIRNVL